MHLSWNQRTPDNYSMTFSTRTYPRTSVYLSEDFVSLVPSGNCQDVLRRRLVPLQIKVATIMIQIRKLYQYPRIQR